MRSLFERKPAPAAVAPAPSFEEQLGGEKPMTPDELETLAKKQLH